MTSLRKPISIFRLAFSVFATVGILLGSALAAEKLKLPETAIKLDKAGILAAYGGKTTEFTHPNTD